MERLRVNISGGGERGPAQPQPLSRNRAIQLIHEKKYPVSLEEKLIDILKKQPSGTYELFFKNIQKYIAQLQNK